MLMVFTQVVELILDRAMNNARNYFTSGQVANWNLTCSLNYLIVISDGYWSSHSSVISIANQIRLLIILKLLQ